MPTYTREKLLSFFASLSVLILMGFVIVQYELALPNEQVTAEMSIEYNPQYYAMLQWRLQRHSLVACIALLMLASFLSKTYWSKISSLIMQSVGYGILLFSDTYTDLSILTIFLALCIEVNLIFKVKSATVISIGFWGCLMFFPRVDSSWYYVTPPASGEKLFAMGLYAILAILVLHMLHFMIDQAKREKASIAYLKKSVMELTGANVDFQDYATRAKEIASREERNRIIREVHDSTGYTLTNITMMMEAAKGLVYSNPAKLVDILATTKEIAQTSLQQIRKTLRMLGKESEVIENPITVLHRIFTTFEQATNVKVQVDYCNIASAPKEIIDERLFRIVQESLTNAFWHGDATKVKAQFWYDEGLSIFISDNGKGAGTIVEGIGLKSMREQLAEIGGIVKIETIRGAGFSLEIRIPQRRSNEA